MHTIFLTCDINPIELPNTSDKDRLLIQAQKVMKNYNAQRKKSKPIGCTQILHCVSTKVRNKNKGRRKGRWNPKRKVILTWLQSPAKNLLGSLPTAFCWLG